jgi:hypothetical protein
MNGTIKLQLLLCGNLELNEESGIKFLLLPDPCEFINVCFPDAVSLNILHMLSMHNHTEDGFPCPMILFDFLKRRAHYRLLWIYFFTVLFIYELLYIEFF